MILSIVVTFNPDLRYLNRNLIAILNQSDKVIVFDNSSNNVVELRELCNSINVELITNSSNIGLGAAYNYVLRNVFVDFDYFVTFDQDTLVGDNTISELMRLFAASAKVGVVGPSFVKRHLELNSEFSVVNSLIQSCSIFSKDVFEKTGFFNEKLFIDSVDFEYCLRCQLEGYMIIRSNRVYIDHELGVSREKYGITYTQHSALRNYYIARNHRYLTTKFFKKFPFFILKKNILFAVHFFNLFFLDQDLEKIKALLKGLKEKVK
jgi:rhamnosyltransferase